MSNILENGTVLPSGLLSAGNMDFLDGFKKTFQNTSFKVGLVKETYDTDSPNNINKRVPEYDVLAFEQNEDRGATVITYKNCIATVGFGSIADFFEYKLRKLEKKKTKGTTPSPAGQDGAIVLLLCLNGISDTAIIVGSLLHPDRKTTLKPKKLHLEGEYNGLNIAVNDDGSAALTFRGATDNAGKVKDAKQKATSFQIQKDGSVNFIFAAGSMVNMTKDGSIQILSSKGNTVFLNDADGEISINQKDGSIVGLTEDGVTIADSSGKEIVSLTKDGIQITSGSTIVEQSTGHTIDSGGVSIKGAGGVKIKDIVGGSLNIKNGMVALGGPAAELLDLFDQLLTELMTILAGLASSAITAGPFPVAPPLATAVAPSIPKIVAIKLLLTTIKGSL